MTTPLPELAGNRLVQATAALRASGTSGLAPYVTAGDGGLDRTLETLQAIEAAGASCVELGVPFSDPIADGPVLQAAADRALAAGTTLEGILQMLARFRAEGGQLPVALMSYANPLLRHGLGQTAARAAAAGADALIVPDMPLEEGLALEQACFSAELCPIFLTAPTSGDARIKEAGRRSRGFLYVVGRVGVTGAATTFDEETQGFLATVRGLSAVPLAVGFGIATAADVKEATRHAELAIVGTAFVRHLHQQAQAGVDPAQAAAAKTRELLSEIS